MPEKVKQVRKGWGFIAGSLTVVIAAIWLVFFIDRAIMPLIVLTGVERVTPDLHHLSYASADSICKSLDLELASNRSRVDYDQPPGTILDQYPLAGTEVKLGRRIEVIISRSERMIICPNVKRRSPREASIIADSLGIKVNSEKTRYRHSRKYPEGVIISQIPEAGDEMNRGDELVLSVSLGRVPAEIVAPDLVGRKIDNVGVVLAKYNLRLGKISRYPDSTVPPGTVLTQNPLPGTPMKSGGRVSVNVAVKPATKSLMDATETDSDKESSSFGEGN